MPLLDCETRPSSPSICSGKVGVFVSDQNIPVIEIRDLHKAYGDLEVLKGIDITAKRGDVVALIGSSGSGKSTLLRCCNMLEISQEGAIIFQGEAVRWSSADHNRRPADPTQVTRLRTNLSMVFQQFNLWAHMTILQNVMEAPVTVLKQDKAEVEGPCSQASRQSGYWRKMRCLPGPAVWRTTAKGGHRPRFGHGTRSSFV